MFLLALMFVIFFAVQLAPTTMERWIVFHFAFIPAAWTMNAWPLWSMAIAPFTYAFLHGDFLHLALNGVMLAVMGQVLERRFGKARFLMVFAAGVIGGALIHALLGGPANSPLIGASAGVGALYGAGLVLYGRGISLGPNTPVLVALAAFFIVSNLLGLILPILSQIAYIAHLGGLISGILITTRLGPEGYANRPL